MRIVDVYFNRDDRTTAIHLVVKPFDSIGPAILTGSKGDHGAVAGALSTSLCFSKNNEGKTLFAAFASDELNVIRRFDMTVTTSEPIHKVFRKEGQEGTIEIKQSKFVSELKTDVAVVDLYSSSDTTKLIVVYADGNVKLHGTAKLDIIWSLNPDHPTEASGAERFLFRTKMPNPDESKRVSKRLRLDEAHSQVVGAQMSPHSGCLVVASTADGLAVYPIDLVSDDFLGTPGAAEQTVRMRADACIYV